MENRCQKCYTEISLELRSMQDLRLLAEYNVRFYEDMTLDEELIKIGGRCNWCNKSLKEIMLGRLNNKKPRN